MASSERSREDSIATSENGSFRRSYSLPVGETSATNAQLRESKSDDVVVQHRLDRYGFILSKDEDDEDYPYHDRGHEHETSNHSTNYKNYENHRSHPNGKHHRNRDHAAHKVNNHSRADRNRSENDHGAAAAAAANEQRTVESRTRKWEIMLARWSHFDGTAVVKRRIRKGVPDAQRSTVWPVVCKVPEKIKAHPGLYRRLVEQAMVGGDCNGVGKTLVHSKSFLGIQDTIERDIHRTFPRHSLFYDAAADNENTGTNSTNKASNHDDEEQSSFQIDLCGANEIAAIRQELESTDLLESAAGQYRLRRILRAYSAYDREVGYCQGMNFLAAMFLTVVAEEQAFWLLVSVMHDPPCRMRGLFSEGMHKTHQVLFVADKLVRRFLPRLAQHLSHEMIHVTMYATQWLLTQFTSSFGFDVVTRLWDCFLYEGWKITYRVMLAILQHSQSDLLSLQFEEILGYFRELPNHITAKIMDDSLKIPLRRRHIKAYEKEWKSRPPEQQNGASI